MIIGKLTAVLAVIFLVTISKVEAKPSEYKPCDVYCGLMGFNNAQPRKIHKSVHHKTRHKSKAIVTHKEKKVLSPLLPASQKEPTSEAPVELVAKAIKYLGMNARQVGVRSTLWCSAFIRKLTQTPGVDDRAISWVKRPHIKPIIGAIAYMRRNGGTGHVGIVAGFTKKGVILISGNHGHRVAKSVYPNSRIVVYVKA